MALTICPDCSNHVSTQAKACPSCGCPLESAHELPKAVARPDIPKNLSIGSQVVNWHGDAFIQGFCTADEASRGIPEGKAELFVHKRGLKLMAGATTLKQLHYSQVLGIGYVARTSNQVIQKSVVKRAVVGALLLGPVGAVVGGASGIGTKKESYKGFIVIDYWDTVEDSALRVMLAVNDDKTAQKLCAKVSKEVECISV